MAERYFQNLECFCVKGVSTTCPGGGTLDATTTVEHSVVTTAEATGTIDKSETARIKTTDADLLFVATLSANLSASWSLDEITIDGKGELLEDLTATYSVKEDLETIGELDNTVDKIVGDFKEWDCQQKLYPSGDGPIAPGFGYFAGPPSWANIFQGKPLWSYIDEGVYQGSSIDGGDSILLSDDESTYIRPSAQVHTEGFYQYNALLTDFLVRPDDSRLRMRVSAPVQNIESKIAPLYTVYNIKLQDPSGNRLIQYEDFSFRGDATEEWDNYTTFSLKPTYNIFNTYDWERRGTPPYIDEVKNYSLVFSLQAVALDDPFDQGFDAGFEENYITPDILIIDGDQYLAIDGTPISTQGHYINPTEHFKLSALEVCNSGGYGPRPEDYVGVYMGVDEIGKRLERKIYPSFTPIATEYPVDVYPYASGLWSTVDDSNTNEDVCGAKALIGAIRNNNTQNYINLDYIFGGPADSGKLVVKFSSRKSDVTEVTKGAFNFQFDQSSKKRWWSPSGAFNTENDRDINQADDIFFDIDTITLEVVAKKAPGTRDYVLDVVGWSDDKLLNITPASGGFIQDPSGICLNDLVIEQQGQFPVMSGFYGDDYSLSEHAISEMEDYYESSGNDHYRLTQYPMVTGTDFELYEVPLKIVNEQVELGLGRDYSVSTLFEHVYLDIYPLPSGASIAHMAINVRYRPQNAFNLSTLGGDIIAPLIPDGRSEGALFPAEMGVLDDPLNAGSGYAPLSALSGVPHRYSSPDTLKSNYARRWRGVEGTVRGPYDPAPFSFAFENPVMDYPFASGYYKFDQMDGRYVISSFLGAGYGNTSGLFLQDPTVYHNIGWRYTLDNANGLFQTQLPGYTGIHKTSDWTSLSDGTTDFTNDPMYGKIADAFDRTVRISQHTQNITFSDLDVSTSGFSAFLRFTPDNTVSGVNYDLFESGVLLSRWETPSELDFVLCFRQGTLAAYARDNLGNIIGIKDDVNFDEYTYPLNVLLTYTDDKKLRLYADNEASGIWDTLRAESAAFDRNPVDADIVVGWSEGSGVGMNMLVSEFGISSGNIISSDFSPILRQKQVTAENFLQNSRVQYLDPDDTYQFNRYKLWDRVNEDVYNDWQIGAFKHCEFGVAFDQWQLRPNTEQIVFEYCCDGTPYFAKTSKSLPSFVNSDKTSVAYHTQIENDFLRFHLSDVPSNFYSAHRRITKDLPRGYKFTEDALVVESVIQHSYSGALNIWDEGTCLEEIGPKLIVSLYTKSKESYWGDPNPYGLVNRKIHYIEPSSCIMRLDSTFSYDDICETKEDWALFDNESLLDEFGEKYFTDDINQMFVQYDLVYPTGSPFRSRLELHSSHVRMADANISPLDSSGVMNMYASGAFAQSGIMNLFAKHELVSMNDSLQLLIETPLYLSSGMNLYTSGNFVGRGFMNMYMEKDLPSGSMSLYTIGAVGDPASDSMNLVMPNTLGILDNNLSLYTNSIGTPESGSLQLFTYAYANPGIRDFSNLFLKSSFGAGQFSPESGSLALSTFGTPVLIDDFAEADLSLYIFGSGGLTANMPLFLSNYRSPVTDSGTLGLYTAAWSNIYTGTASVTWDGDNYGKGIDIDDNIYATVPVSNEIRGVDLTGYGSCSSDSPSKAIDQPLITDCTTWRGAVCNEAGAFRAKATYSNSGALSFDGVTIGYDKNYYGIRKIDNLIPGFAYDTTVTIKTGDTDPIPVPRNFEEWEYGKCGPGWNATDGLCTSGCGQNIVDSGVKLIADDGRGVPPSGDGFEDPLFLIESGRNVGDNYGAAVAVQNEVMLVGSPNLTLPDLGGVESSGAGGVFIYRRGEDVAGKKAYWDFEAVLALPSGYRRDYIDSVQEDVLVFEDLSIDANQWAIGQEGRGFGSAVDLANSGDRQVAVVGAPKAKWSRTFEDLATSGVKVAAVVISDRFNWPDNKADIKRIRQGATYYDLLYKYFSAPWYSEVIYGGTPNEFQPAIDLRLIVLQPADFSKPLPDPPFLDQDESWITHAFIPRLDDNYRNTYSQAHIQDEIASGFYDAFFAQFPSGLAVRNSQPVYSGVPAFLNLFEDTSDSMRGSVSNSTFNIFDDIQNFFNDYTFESGVFDQIEEKPESGVIKFVQANGDNWESLTNQSIQDLLDTGNLLSTFNNYNNPNLTFIASGVGQKWNKTDANEFNLPPSSGGRAYIFEKERENWNCVQVIISPNDVVTEGDDGDLGTGEAVPYQWPDRFGHSVAISKNGDIVTVGSPFTTSPCRIYERSQSEIDRLFNGLRDWLVINNPTVLTLYDSLLSSQGEVAAKEGAYDALTASERFAFRNDTDFWSELPQQYVWTYEYTYQDIQYTGTNSFLAGKFAPTSRLGWSTSVDDDGYNVAFGAPTDSFNEFEDLNVWGTGLKTWASYNYAGAVRMFSSRQYYPHSGVVEFGRFGNLDRSQHPQERDAGYYDQWNSIFDPAVNPWRRMDFSEIEIPQDAGLAFIMTPELDAASDEIIQNIKDWLALGDRNLVVVGNDPVWEENGLYENSNVIVNKILNKLGADMRIYAAETQERSLQQCLMVDGENQNITKALTPRYSSRPTIQANNYYASGVGDIRIDISKYGLTNYTNNMSCPEGKNPPQVINERCEMPHEQGGDLRAQWLEECQKESNGQTIDVIYARSWPFEYGNFDTGCTPEPDIVVDRTGFDPVPVLTTREYVPEQVITVPTTSGKILEYTEIKEWVVYEVGETVYNFADNQVEYVQFSIGEDENSEPAGKFTSYSQGGFFDPDPLNTRDSLLQATGTPVTTQEVSRYNEQIYPNALLGIVESGRKVSDNTHNNSKVYLIATQWSEDDASRGLQGTQNTGNNDKNTLFYLNLIQKDCTKIPVGQHLGGFTGRLSLEDAYFQDSSPPGGSSQPGHTLASKINSATFDNFTEGVEYLGSANISNLVDYVWIAHPASKASNDDINRIRRWLDNGEKKLIITYNAMRPSNTQEIAENVADLCTRLGITSGPLFDPINQLYSVVDGRAAYDQVQPLGEQDIIDAWAYSKETAGTQLQIVNNSVDVFAGCNGGYSYNNTYNSDTDVPGLWFSDESTLLYSSRDGEFDTENAVNRKRFVPISGGADYEELMRFDYPITEERYNTEDITQWTMDVNGNVELSSQAIINSGYRVFMNYVSEQPTDKFDICGEFKGHSFDPDPNGEFGGGVGGNDYEGKCQFKFQRDANNYRNVLTVTKDIRVNGNLGLQWFTPYKFINPAELDPGVLPESVRFLSMSGCPLEIEEEVTTVRTSGLVVVDVRVEERWLTFPGYEYTIPGYYRPTSELSARYCKESSDLDLSSDCDALGANIVENGPVVVAEQPETFSSFPAGKKRSRIIVVSDSTMLQGQCPDYRAANGDNVEFIRSLYPLSPEQDNSDDSAGGGNNFKQAGGQRWWEFVQKLRAPERGSAAKYYAVSGWALNNNMITPLFNGPGVQGNLSDFTDLEDTYDPRTVSRPEEITDPVAIAQAKVDFADQCFTERGMLPLYSGDYLGLGDYDVYLTPLNLDIDRDVIFDQTLQGGITELMKVNGKDYLDLEFYYERSGCLGDLFGYSVDLTNNKLVVGTPFNAFYSEDDASGIVEWSNIGKYYTQTGDPSGVLIAEDGGAGAAFVFNKTGRGSNVVVENLPWEIESKIRPSSINIGITEWGITAGSTIDDLIYFKGPTNYEDIFNAKRYGSRSDNFGASVAIDCDMILVGAPNHDFETLHDYKYSGVVDPNGLNSAFLRKSFNASFDIPLHEYYDLGDSGVRQDERFINSGQFILNAGAVFNYRYEMTDIGSRQQEWVYAQKLYAEGYGSRIESEYNGIPQPGDFFPPLTASGSDNDRFGFAVAIDRAYRGDSDYTAAIGSPLHHFPTSGEHRTKVIAEAGAAYTFDAMLREQTDAIPNSGGWMDVKVFSDLMDKNQTLFTRVTQNETGGSLTYQVTGLLNSNSDGEVFLEVSGYDPSSVGFIAHRPYVHSIVLNINQDPPSLNDTMSLIMSGGPALGSGSLPLYMLGDSSGIVYNSMNNYVFGAYTNSGTMNLITIGQDSIDSGMNLYIQAPEQTVANLPFILRGY